jgi:hypothetical protein
MVVQTTGHRPDPNLRFTSEIVNGDTHTGGAVASERFVSFSWKRFQI